MSLKHLRSTSLLLALSVGLLLLVWFTRLNAIQSFPPFVDELVHIFGSEQGYTVSPLANATLGRQGTIWWLMLFQPHRASPFWIARVVTVLAFLPGLAAMIGLARLFAGTPAALFTGLLFLFSSYHMFFGRLALADPISGSVVLVAVWAAARLARRQRLTDALLTGLLLAAAVVAKINVLPYLGIPLAAALTLRAPHHFTWRAQLRWLGVALGSAVGLITAFIFTLRLFGHDFFTNSVSLALTQRGNSPLEVLFDPARILANISVSLGILAAYTGPLALALLLLSLLLLAARRQFYLLLCLIGPTATLWFSQVQESRFFVVPLALLFITAAISLAQIARRPPIRAAVVVLMLLWGAVQWLPFTRLAATQPLQLPLPPEDIYQYLESDASATGYAQAQSFLAAYPVREVVALLANCQAYRYMLLGQYPVLCPRINPNGSSIPDLVTLLEDKRQPGVYAILQAIPYVPQTAPGKLLTIIDRPGDGPDLAIYDLAPDS
ncbi:MAG: hypothetical protein JNJ78_20590 [Anaerolineae bacterium]|nr:hypothetical protein [Anaerolineae bacterium]